MPSPLAAGPEDGVSREVLPAIRKDNGYILGEAKVVTGEFDMDACWPVLIYPSTWYTRINVDAGLVWL